MTASTRTAPRGLTIGKVSASSAAVAMAIVFAIIIVIVALTSSKAAVPATTGAKAAPPPAVIDHGTSNGEMARLLAAESARLSALSLGGWGGPRVGAIKTDSPNAVKVTTYGGWTIPTDSPNAVKVTTYGGWNIPTPHHGRHPGFRPQ